MASVCRCYPVKMSSIGGGSKNSCFWGEHKNVCNLDVWCWILIKFGGVHGECVVMLPCEYELNRRGIAFWRQLKGI